MWERLLLSATLLLAGSTAYFLFKQWHLQRINGTATSNARPVLLYFHSVACAPCVTQEQQLQKVSERFTRTLTIERIDASANSETASRYGVFTVPTTLLLDPTGQVKHINYGLADAGKLARQVESVL
jgi:thioredoxin-like negative regulator of GroEL